MENTKTHIPDGWVETTLGNSAEIIAGFAFKSEDFGEYGTPVAKITEIKPPYVDFRNCQKVNVEKYTTNRLEKYKLGKGDFLVAMTGATIGKVGMITSDTEAYLNQRVAKISEKENISNDRFIYYSILSPIFTAFIEKFAFGAVQANISTTEIGNFPILLPSLPEQQAIARMLSSFDDKIELLREQNETLEKTAQTIFAEWFGKYSPERPEELPEGWRVGKLGTEFDITIGRTPPRAEQEWFSETPTGKKWISIKDIGNSGPYIFKTSEYLTDEAVKRFNIPVIPVNTTILSFKMTVGKLSITTEEMLSNEAIAHLKIRNGSLLSSEYIYCYLQKLDFNALGSTSSIVTAINSSMIKELDVLVPDNESLARFNQYIQAIFEKIHNNLSQIEMLGNTRDTLLPKLMNGEVRLEI